MLKNIRDNIQGTAAKVIIGFISIPFIFFGIDSFFNAGGPPPAAVVNGEEIQQFELAQAIAMQKRRLIGMMGDSIDAAMLEDSVLRGPALQGLVDQKLLLLAADDKGLTVAPKVLNKTIVSMEQFHSDGQFSQEKYLQVLRSLGFGNASFKELLSTDLLLAQLRSGVSGTAFLTASQLDRAIALAEQKRSYNYLMIAPEDLLDEIDVSDSEVKEWYEANSNEFLSSPAVKLSYIELKINDFFEPVSEEDIRAEYEQELKSLGSLEERRAAHILIGTGERTRKQAREIIDHIQTAIANGADFAKLAEEKSEDPGSAGEGGDLGYTAGDAFPETFEAALAALEPGQVSDVVETEDGLHLIKLLDVKTQQPASFDSRRAEIEARLQRMRAEPKLIATAEDLRDLVFNSDGLAAPANELGLTVRQSDWLSRDSDSELMREPRVAAAAFDEQLRRESLNSEVMELRSDHYLVLHVDDFRPPAVRPLESVREEVVSRIKRERAAELVSARAESLRERVAAGESVESLATAAGLEWQAVIDGVRTAQGIPRPVLDEVFSLGLDAEAKITVVEGAGDRRWVVRLYRVEDVDPTAVPAEQRQRLASAFTRGRASQEFSAYFNALKQSAEIRVGEAPASP